MWDQADDLPFEANIELKVQWTLKPCSPTAIPNPNLKNQRAAVALNRDTNLYPKYYCNRPLENCVHVYTHTHIYIYNYVCIILQRLIGEASSVPESRGGFLARIRASCQRCRARRLGGPGLISSKEGLDGFRIEGLRIYKGYEGCRVRGSPCFGDCLRLLLYVIL